MDHDKTYATLDDWIRREAVPFTLAADDALNAAIDQVMAASGPVVELLGFGEALHGGEEILLLRNRFFQRLVEAHGFSAIAVESSFPKGRAVDEYVNGRGPAAYAEVEETGFSHNFGRLAANRELVEWMRAYNADPVHSLKLHFYGFDSPTEMTGTDSPRQPLLFALDYLAAMDSASGQRRWERVVALLGSDADWENPAAMMDPAQSIGLSEAATALRIETEDLITELTIRRPELAAASGRERYHEAVRFAELARQMLNYHAGLARQSEQRVSELLGIRDVIMADNLAYIAARERGKVLVFAHNSHLQRSKFVWQWGPMRNIWWPVGAHLAEMFGPRYAVIGTGVGVSEQNGIGQPEPGTLEARLTALPETTLFIPTHLGRGLPAEEVAELPERTGSMKNQTYFPLKPQSLADFDWLAVLDSVTYQRGGPPLP